MCCLNEGILTNKTYTPRDFELKLSTLLKANDVKYTDNGKNITFNNWSFMHVIIYSI